MALCTSILHFRCHQMYFHHQPSPTAQQQRPGTRCQELHVAVITGKPTGSLPDLTNFHVNPQDPLAANNVSSSTISTNAIAGGGSYQAVSSATMVRATTVESPSYSPVRNMDIYLFLAHLDFNMLSVYIWENK